ncbi:MAG TPA: FUSC family membrane protein, partial [Longimicrobiaceae bacterium]
MQQTGAPPPPAPRAGPAGRLAESLRASVKPAPAPPAVAAGLRTATATVAPLLAGHALGIPEAMLAGLGGFMVSRADNGGAYRSRATAMATQGLAVAAGAVAGALLRPWPGAAVPAVLLWTTAASLARAYGPAAGTAGVVATVMFVVALSTPSVGTAAALEHGGWVLAGGAWAMLLSLALWPVRFYRPGMLAVAACYRALADYAEAMASPPEATEPAPRGSAAFLAARQAVEAARATLAAIRRGRSGESVRGERLLVLLESADRVLINLVALGDVLEGAAAAGERRVPRAELAALAAELRECARL